MLPNLPVLIASAFIPFLVAFIWYHPKVFGGTTWATVAGLTLEQNNTPIKPYQLGLSILLNFFIAFGIYNLGVHQSGLFGLVGGDVAALQTGTGAAFLAEYGHRHLSFGHGMIHGGIQTILCFILPILGYAVIFERKSRKYLFINLGFWILSLALMGGVISRWGGNPI